MRSKYSLRQLKDINKIIMEQEKILFVMGSINPERGGVARVGCNLADGLGKLGFISYSLSCQVDSSGYFRESFIFSEPNVLSSNNQKQVLDLFNQLHFSFVIVENPQSPWVIHAISILKGLTILIGQYHNSPFGANSILSDKSYLSFFNKFRWFRSLVFLIRTMKYHSHWKRVNDILDHIVLLSETYYEELIRFAFFPREKVTVLPNPFPIVDEKTYEKHNVLLFVGRIAGVHKGIQRLLNVWKEISNRLPDWQLKVVGGGKELPHWQIVAKKMQLKNIYFEGFQTPDVYYKEAKIFLMTSLYEGFPMTLVEAMQYGCVPVVFNSFAAVNDIIDDRNNGIIIQAFDDKDYINAVVDLAIDPESLDYYAEAAKVKARQFDLNIIVDKWFSLFRELKNGK